MAPFYRLRRQLRRQVEDLRHASTHRRRAWQWRHLPQARLRAELPLGDGGADNLWLHDVDGDGRPELLFLQGQGIFQSRIYHDQPRYAFLARGRGLTCLTVYDLDGQPRWRYGTPAPDTDDENEIPYASHAGERMLTTFEEDGHTKIALLVAGARLVVLDGATGREERATTLPADNFALIASARTGDGLRLVVSVMDAGTGDHAYGTPTLLLDRDLREVARYAAVGSGHRLVVRDFDGDGDDEILDGYELRAARDGTRRWLLDAWHGRAEAYEPQPQHLDHAATFDIDGRWHAALAGSDALYWIDDQGRTLWRHQPRHAQYAFVGRFRGRPRPSIVLLDSLRDSYLVGLDLDGTVRWRRPAWTSWPRGCPRHLRGAWFHMGEPGAHWRAAADEETGDLVIHCEGGWPYAIDGRGEPALTFPCPPRATRRPRALPRHRADDFGEGFQARCADLDGDGRQEVVLFDRRTAWIYAMPRLAAEAA